MSIANTISSKRPHKMPDGDGDGTSERMDMLFLAFHASAFSSLWRHIQIHIYIYTYTYTYTHDALCMRYEKTHR
jgi:hypothetical protein